MYNLKTKSDVIDWLDFYDITSYSVNKDLSVDVSIDVYLVDMELSEIPVKFNRVEGNFDCSKNNLKSLKNCPNYVKGNFSCNNNNVTNLDYLPTNIGKDINISVNSIISLKGSPEVVHGDFVCYGNKIESLLYSPKKVFGDFYCYDNLLKTLHHSPQYVEKVFACFNNPIESLKGFKCEFKDAFIHDDKSGTKIKEIESFYKDSSGIDCAELSYEELIKIQLQQKLLKKLEKELNHTKIIKKNLKI